MFALNFYSDLYLDVLRANRKTLSIRLGDKRFKYREGEIVWVTIGQRFGRRQKLFAAVIDRVEVTQNSDRTRTSSRSSQESTTSKSQPNTLLLSSISAQWTNRRCHRAIITSVDFITAVALSPTLRPRRRRLDREMIEAT